MNNTRVINQLRRCALTLLLLYIFTIFFFSIYSLLHRSRAVYAFIENEEKYPNRGWKHWPHSFKTIVVDVNKSSSVILEACSAPESHCVIYANYFWFIAPSNVDNGNMEESMPVNSMIHSTNSQNVINRIGETLFKPPMNNDIESFQLIFIPFMYQHDEYISIKFRGGMENAKRWEMLNEIFGMQNV